MQSAVILSRGTRSEWPGGMPGCLCTTARPAVQGLMCFPNAQGIILSLFKVSVTLAGLWGSMSSMAIGKPGQDKALGLNPEVATCDYL